MGAGPTASQKARSPLPKVPCDKAVLREACSWEPLAVREESVCAVGAAAAEALGCRPGGSGVDPFSLSLSLPPLPLRAQLPGKIIQATPLKRPHGRAPS